MWPFKPRRHITATDKAREALGLSEAVGNAVGVEPLPDGTARFIVAAEKFMLDTPPEQPRRLVETSTPEYHLNTVNNMVVLLTQRINDRKAERETLADTYIADKAELEQKHLADMAQRETDYSDRDAALCAELDGLEKSVNAYLAAQSVLLPEAPVFSIPEPAHVQQVGRVKRQQPVTKQANISLKDADQAVAKRRPSRPGRRETIAIPEGHEAVRDAEGKAPINSC